LFGFYVDKNKNLILTGLIFLPTKQIIPHDHQRRRREYKEKCRRQH